MELSTIAKPYAQAIFEIAEENMTHYRSGANY